MGLTGRARAARPDTPRSWLRLVHAGSGDALTLSWAPPGSIPAAFTSVVVSADVPAGYDTLAAMVDAGLIVARLAGDRRLRLADDYDCFVEQVDPLLRSIDRDLTVVGGRIGIRFAEAPTAAALARALDEVEQHARRIVSGFDLGVRPELLRGAGARLVPPEHGLQVKGADPGSLEVVLVFGGLGQAVTAQPLSFAFNLGALMGFGRAVLRAIPPNRRTSRRIIKVDLPVMPHGDQEEDGAESQRSDDFPSLSRTAGVHINMTSADGSTVEIDCTRRR